MTGVGESATGVEIGRPRAAAMSANNACVSSRKSGSEEYQISRYQGEMNVKTHQT